MFLSILYTILMINSPSQQQKLIIEDSGLANFGINDNAMIFYIQVREIGPTSSRIFAEAAECCETLSADEADCGTIKPIGGDMGISPCEFSRNLTLFFPTPYGYNRHGSCLIDITINKDGLRHRIEFDTVIRTGIVPDGLDPFYDPEVIRPCATLDLDPFKACEPVSCPWKYNGLRNFFNTTKQLCDKSQSCGNGTIYMPKSNTCRKHSPVTIHDLSAINQHLPINENDDKNSGIICHRGKMRHGVCICDPGWETIRADEGTVSTLNFCNVPCTKNPFEKISTLMNIDAYVLYYSISIATIIVIIVCIWNEFYERKFRNDSGKVLFFKPVYQKIH